MESSGAELRNAPMFVSIASKKKLFHFVKMSQRKIVIFAADVPCFAAAATLPANTMAVYLTFFVFYFPSKSL